MYRRNLVVSNFDKNTFLHMTLAMIWVAGLSLGIAADRLYGEALRACLLRLPHLIPTFVGTVCVNLFPLLISAYAVLFFPSAVYVLCMLRAFALGAALSGVTCVFGSAGSMICGLLLFSLLVYSPVLIWFWMQNLGRRNPLFLLQSGICTLIGLAVACLDRAVIAPFLQEIMII